jgi:primosomal protein N' (replication factor Y)
MPIRSCPHLLELCRWTARYYLAPLADVIATIVPAAVRTGDRKVVRLLRRLTPRTRRRSRGARPPARVPIARSPRRSGRLAAGDARSASRRRAPRARRSRHRGCGGSDGRARAGRGGAASAPAAAQSAALDALARAGRRHVRLVRAHGVTERKTEVFLGAAAHALRAGRDAIVLVPEIALTHQMVERVRERFGADVAILHSGLGPRERWTEWRRILRGEARDGRRDRPCSPPSARSASSSSTRHDPRTSRRKGCATMRATSPSCARLAGGVVVLASATPSAETYQAGLDGRHVLLELPERPTAHSLPPVDVVDLRGRDAPRLFSEDLRTALEANLAGGQTLVFLNRRGFAVYLQCAACGTAIACPHCSVTLSLHRAARALVCHHCRHTRRPPDACPECGAARLEAFGVGTEQIEAALRAGEPLAVVDRLDRDAAQRPGAQRRILRAWRAGETDILVGTQMVSKGHDVPGVTLVAVLLADLSLNVPDFRAAERTLQLLVQVAGRAGRGRDAGRVLVQTFRPEHPSVVAAVRHDYRGFMEGELARRRTLGYRRSPGS